MRPTVTDIFKNAVSSAIKQFGVELTEVQTEKLYDFYKIVVDYNKKINLTAITDEYDFAIKHIADSLSSTDYIKKNSLIFDLGAGAGFPSVPLKILRDDIETIMMDALEKRVSFLNYAINELNLKNISAVHIRAEDAGKNPVYREKADAVVCRAVGKSNVLLELAAPLIKKNGVFINYKGKDVTDVVEAASSEKKLNMKRICRKEYMLITSDGHAERNLFVYEKTEQTLKEYPRNFSQIKKNPL